MGVTFTIFTTEVPQAVVADKIARLESERRIPKYDDRKLGNMHDPMHIKISFHDTDVAAKVRQALEEEGLTFKESEEDVPKKADA